MRSAARRLELRSIDLAPEYYDLSEGLRAALAVGLPLLVAVAIGRPEWGWAVFAAFWTCLCDIPGPDRLRRRLLGLFVICGGAMALAGSWVTHLYAMLDFGPNPGAAMLVGPAMVFLATLGGSRIAWGDGVGTLLAVVAVVAVGYPKPIDHAMLQAAAFLAGAGWTYLLINLVWRFDPAHPVRRLTGAVILRLVDMIDGLGDGDPGRHGAHRRSVRIGIERLRGLMARYAEESAEPVSSRTTRRRSDLDRAEAMFGALIALDQAAIDRTLPEGELAIVARGARAILLAWRADILRGGTGEPLSERLEARLERARDRLCDPVAIGCLTAMLRAGAPSSESNEPPAPAPARQEWAGVIRQAGRQAVGLIMVYCATISFHLGYPYWAAMAVVVVLRGEARITWTRAVERIVGSLLGGGISVLLLQFVAAPPLLIAIAIGLAAVAIPLRAVNYTVFVVFLTMLFVIVTDTLHPGAGSASARMLDNVVGSIAALLAALWLWPERGPSLGALIRAGIDANQRYAQAVRDDRPPVEVEQARRSAGLASVAAEIALHDPKAVFHRRHASPQDRAAIAALRRTAGEAAILRHRALATARERQLDRRTDDGPMHADDRFRAANFDRRPSP
ncbi:FUSC family protein [Sphingomonas sp. Marseille-Q8236]